MSLDALFGERYNALSLMTGTVTASGVLSGFSATGLYDGFSTAQFFFDTVVPPYLNFDFNQTVNGDFSTTFSGGVPGTGWILAQSPSPTVTKVGNAMQVNGSAGQYVYFDLRVPAGATRTVTCLATPPTGAGGGATVIIRNTDTGSTLDQFGAWSPVGSPNAWISLPTALGGATLTTTFTVESYSSCLVDAPTIRFEFYAGTGAGSTYPTYDDFFVWPKIDFISFHGHNIQSGVSLNYRSGSAASPASVACALAGRIRQPAFFGTFTARNERFGRISFDTTPNPANAPAMYIGEIVLGERRTLLRKQNYGHEVALIHPQDRSEGDVGPLQAFPRTVRGRRRVTLPFTHFTDVSFAEMQELLERSRGGALPIVVVPDPDDASSVVLGRVKGPEWTHTRDRKSKRTSSLIVDELIMPTVVA